MVVQNSYNISPKMLPQLLPSYLSYSLHIKPYHEFESRCSHHVNIGTDYVALNKCFQILRR